MPKARARFTLQRDKKVYLRRPNGPAAVRSQLDSSARRLIPPSCLESGYRCAQKSKPQKTANEPDRTLDLLDNINLGHWLRGLIAEMLKPSRHDIRGGQSQPI